MSKILFIYGIAEISFLVYKSSKVVLSRNPLVNVRQIAVKLKTQLTWSKILKMGLSCWKQEEGNEDRRRRGEEGRGDRGE